MATPLLQEVDSSDNETEVPDIPDDSVVIRENKHLFKSSEPKDKYYMAYFIFYLLGMVTLLPWNFFITADDYWLYKFRNVSSNVSLTISSTKRTPLQASFTSYISVASAVPSFIFLIVNIALTNRVSLHKRVIGSLVVMLGLFIMTLVFVTTNTDKWQNGFFIMTITTVVLLNICSAVLTGSIFGAVGRFCPVYITATIGGQALGGIFAAVAQIASLSIGASSVHSAFVYFIIGSLTIFTSIICYIILTKSVFFKFHLYERTTQNEFENELLRPRIINHKIIFKKMWTYGLSMFTVFAITLSVYPSVTVLIESEGKGEGHKWNDVYFVPTIAYLLFSIGDYLGRILAGRIQKPRKGYVLLILSAGRWVFIPLLMLCNAQPRSHWAVVFDHDYQYIIILFMCAISNGYLANISAICAPRVVESHEKETASTMMSVFVGVGLALGSGVSLYMVKWL